MASGRRFGVRRLRFAVRDTRFSLPAAAGQVPHVRGDDEAAGGDLLADEIGRGVFAFRDALHRRRDDVISRCFKLGHRWRPLPRVFRSVPRALGVLVDTGRRDTSSPSRARTAARTRTQ